MSCSPTTAGALDLSGAAEADRDLAGFHDDRHIAAALRKLQHSRKPLLVFQHVYVLERNFAASVSLPGARSVGSEIFAENENFFVHVSLDESAEQ